MYMCMKIVQWGCYLFYQEIDGKALLLLNSDLMMKYMGLKLGPALKLCNIVEKLKTKKWHEQPAYEPAVTALRYKLTVQADTDRLLLLYAYILVYVPIRKCMHMYNHYKARCILVKAIHIHIHSNNKY